MINISRNIYISFMWVGVFFLLGRGFSSRETCGSPARLCKTRYNTTAPMYGVSLTSGQPVTIVQKFPDLLQQVVFEVCEWVFTLSYLWAWSFKIRSIACKLKNEVRFITFVARSWSVNICDVFPIEIRRDLLVSTLIRIWHSGPDNSDRDKAYFLKTFWTSISVRLFTIRVVDHVVVVKNYQSWHLFFPPRHRFSISLSC